MRRQQSFVLCLVVLIAHTTLINAALTTHNAVVLRSSLRKPVQKALSSSATHPEHKTLLMTQKLHSSVLRFQNAPPPSTAQQLVGRIVAAAGDNPTKVFAVGLILAFRDFFKKSMTEMGRQMETAWEAELQLLVDGVSTIIGFFTAGIGSLVLKGVTAFFKHVLIPAFARWGRENTIAQMKTVLLTVFGGPVMFMKGLWSQFANHAAIKSALRGKLTLQNAMDYADKMSLNIMNALIGSKRFMLPSVYKGSPEARRLPKSNYGHFEHGYDRLRTQFGHASMCTSAPETIQIALGSSEVPNKGRDDMCSIM